MVPLVGGEWAEVKTLATGAVEEVRRVENALVGHLTGSAPLVHELESASDWIASAGSGAAKCVASEIPALPTESTFATQLEWRRIGVPCASSGLQPFDQLRGVGRRLTG